LRTKFADFLKKSAKFFKFSFSIF